MVGSHCTGPGPGPGQGQGQGTGKDGFLYYRPQQQLLKGSVFAPVCQSFCSGGVNGRGCAWQGSVCAWQGEGVCMTGGQLWRRGHVWQGDMHGRGVHGGWKDVWQGVCVVGEACMAGGVCGRRDGHCSRQYLTGMHSYYTMYCTHYTVTETGTGNHCFLLCPSRSLSLSRAVCMSHYTHFFFATCFRLAPSCQVIHNSTKLYKGRELTVNAVLNTGFSTHEGSGWQANIG